MSERRPVINFGTCLALNGVNQYATVPDNTSLRIAGNYTIMALVKMSVLPGTYNIFSKGSYDNPSTNENYGLWVDQSGGNYRFYAQHTIGGSYRNSSGIANTAFKAGYWYHLAVKYDGSNFTNYLNGQKIGTGISGGGGGTPDTSSQILTIGVRNDVSKNTYLNGAVDEIRIYNTDLSDANVRKAYRYESVPTTNLKAYYKFDEKTGLVLLDSSGLGNNGAIVSGAYSKSVFAFGRRLVV